MIPKIQKIQLISCLLIAVSLPALPFIYINIFSAIFLLTTVLKYIITRNDIKKGKDTVLEFILFICPFILIVGLYGLDILDSYEIVESLKKLEKKAAFLIFPLIYLLDPLFIKNNVKSVTKAFCVGVMFVNLVCYVNAFYRFIFDTQTLQSSSNWDNISVLSATDNAFKYDYFFYQEFLSPFAIPPFYFSLYVSFSISILFFIYLFRAKRASNKKIILIVAYILISVLVLVQLSVRGVIIPFIILGGGVLVWNLLRSKVPKITIIGISLFAVILLVLIFQAPLVKKRLFKDLQDSISNYHEARPNSIKLRLIIYECAVNVLKQSPLIGYGQRESNELLWQCSQEKLPKEYTHKYNAHNQYLQFSIQFGLLGLIIILTPIVSPILYFRRCRSLYIIFFSLVLIGFMSESMLSRFHGFMFFFFFYTILLSQMKVNHASMSRPN
ncbi:MAG: O-antigen ligase family protein [Bacteroidota bacterium]